MVLGSLSWPLARAPEAPEVPEKKKRWARAKQGQLQIRTKSLKQIEDENGLKTSQQYFGFFDVLCKLIGYVDTSHQHEKEAKFLLQGSPDAAQTAPNREGFGKSEVVEEEIGVDASSQAPGGLTQPQADQPQGGKWGEWKWYETKWDEMMNTNG